MTKKNNKNLVKAVVFTFFKLITTFAKAFGLSKAETDKLLRNKDVQDSIEKSVLDVHKSVLKASKEIRKDG